MRKLRFDLDVQPNALLCPNPQEFYSKAYITEDIANNYRAIPGVKSATKIANVLFTDLLKASTCSFTSDPNPLDAIDIDVCPLSAMAEICRFDLEASFVSLQMARGSNGVFTPQAFMSYYWDEMAKEISQEVAVLRWQGNTTSPGTGTFLDLCDGYELKFTGDNEIITPVSTAPITTTNVLDEMGAVYALLPGAVRSQTQDLRFYVSSNVYQAYQIAAALGNTMSYITSALAPTFLGIQLVVCDGMSNDTMVLTNRNNLIYAFDGEDDGKALKAVNLEDSVAEPLLRTRANLKVGFFYVNPAEIVFYQD